MNRAQAPQGGRRARRAALLSFAARAIVACALLAAGGVARAAEPAAGGTSLLDASETAIATVVGVVRQPSKVDLHGFAASLEVERVLAGTLTSGASQRIGWEELASSRPPRFADGDRVLIALAPLPGASLWRQRFPAAPGTAPVLVVAADGDAFLRQPDPRTIDLLARYLALAQGERAQSTGVNALAALVRGADPTIAEAALRRLAAIPGLDTRLGEDGRASLAAAAEDASRPLALRSALVAWIGRARIVTLRPALESLAKPGSELQAEAIDALAVLDGGLAPDRSEALLRSSDPTLRAVGVRYASGLEADQKIRGMMRGDPAPEVRSAAVRALVARNGSAAIDDASVALFDDSPDVRAATAQVLGALGAPAVPTLRRLALERMGTDTHGPVAALSLAGPAGAKALAEIAATHPDPAVRKLALFGLGQGPKENEVTLDPVPAQR